MSIFSCISSRRYSAFCNIRWSSDKWTSNKSSRRGLPSYRRRFFFSFGLFYPAKQLELPAASRHFHSPYVIRTSLSDFNTLTWPKELPVYSLRLYIAAVVAAIRGDPIEETSSSHKAPLELFSSHKHVDIRKVLQSAFLERCAVRL